MMVGAAVDRSRRSRSRVGGTGCTVGGGCLFDDEDGMASCFNAASWDLREEWKSCCMHALGFGDAYDENENDSDLLQEEERRHDRAGNIKAGGEISQERDEPSSAATTTTAYSIVNLVPDNSKTAGTADATMAEDGEDDAMDVDGNTSGSDDPWTAAAAQIGRNIGEMRAFVDKRRHEYVSPQMSEGDAGLIQSTVTSFAATTANEIESLRQLIRREEEEGNAAHTQQQQGNGGNFDRMQHRTGVVGILMTRLREEVTDPFRELQKQRSRPAVGVYQNPLRCELTTQHHKKKKNPAADDSLDSLLERDEREHELAAVDQRFTPKRPSHRLQGDLLDSYDDERNGISPAARHQSRPPSLLLKKKNKRPPSSSEGGGDGDGDGEGDDDNMKVDKENEDLTTKRMKPSNSPPSVAAAATGQQQQQQQQQLPREYDPAATVTDPAELERESAQLALLRRDGDLDAVRKMEERMVDITGLIAQFANLVSSQQEEVRHIHDATASAKDNVEQGKEQLVDAKARTQASKHFMATSIAVMAFVLLFFHTVRP